ncbi:PREDICTED: uncharacterized protein LOC107349727 [Acropora digitifera]|uniref:uncharacterized protein LOC107349727 n=1 Tax=Acropora digitifera TaxID=70779 RepID=UPI00077A5D5E|nr:PREDICTED: uncharacterized protein LOC107349727 [Acropora digitifera]
MALVLIYLGRVAFFVLYGLQSYLLTSYPAVYSNTAFYLLILLFIPALVLWLWILCNCNDDEEETLQWSFAVWPAYVWIALIPLIGIIFGGNDPIENKLDSQVFFGPNVLKMTLCLSPLLLLLLLSTGTDSMSYRELIWPLSLRIALDLFDTVEMLEVVLEENIVSHNIPRSFENAIITFACISFILSPLHLMQIKLTSPGEWEYHEFTSICHKTLQILAVNCVFLCLRLALFLGYGKDASIFIAKNGIVILLSLFEICSECECCGCSD